MARSMACEMEILRHKNQSFLNYVMNPVTVVLINDRHL